MGLFDGLPVPPDKKFLRDSLSKIDENWATTRFDSLPHVVQILTSKDREGEVHSLKEQIEVVEDIVDEVVHAYHGGFNKAIQNYSQILRLFSESSESIASLKVDLAESKKCLGSRNKQLHQLWYRSVTLRHIIALLDQIESIAKVPGRIEKFLSEKQFYAAVQVYVQSSVMLEREGLQTVGALQDIRSELSKLRGILFFKILEELHLHLYNKGEYSLVTSSGDERDDELPTTTATSFDMGNVQSFSRRTKPIKDDKLLVEGQRTFDTLDEEGSIDYDEPLSDGNSASMKNGDVKTSNPRPLIPSWLSSSTPDEFVEAIRKSGSPVHVKYLQTMVECLCMLGKVAAAGAVICQRLRPTVHEIITSKIKGHAHGGDSFASGSTSSQTAAGGLKFVNGQLNGLFQSSHKLHHELTNGGTLLSVSPVSPLMTPSGKAQIAAKELLDSVLDTIAKILDNHVVVGELLEARASQNIGIETPKSQAPTNNSEASQSTGGFSIGFSLNVFQSECQQLICELLRATPEAVATDSAVQTVRLPSKGPSKEKKGGAEDELAFSFRFVDTFIPAQNQGTDLSRQGWNRRSSIVSQDGYGSASVLPEQGIYLAASVYRPVLQFTDKITSLLPKRYSTLGNDTLLTFTEKFLKDHFLPTMFVDYRKSVQQAISSPTAFRPKAPPSSIYSSSVENGRPILQGLLAIDYIAKEVLGWADAIPKFAVDLVKYVQTFLERTYERCRTSYMEAVLEKQSYMLIGRHDIEKLMRLDPASSCLPSSRRHIDRIISTTTTNSVESELCDLLLNLRPIKQENLIRDDNKLILLACLSDSLQYTAESLESLAQRCSGVEVDGKSLTSFADDYRRLAIDCLKVLRMEMQLETIFNMQEMINSDYLEAQTAEEPDDFIIALTALITRRDEEVSPFVDEKIRSYIFGGICAVAAHTSIKALPDIKSINLFGVQQICRNSIALEQTLAAIPSIDSESVQQKLDGVCTYYELLNMPYEALLAFMTEHNYMFTPSEYANLLKVEVPGRDIPEDALQRVAEILPH